MSRNQLKSKMQTVWNDRTSLTPDAPVPWWGKYPRTQLHSKNLHKRQTVDTINAR